MIAKISSIVMAGALLAGPMAPALAQTQNPAGNMGSNRSMTASPGTQDNAASGMNSNDMNNPGSAGGNYAGSSLSSHPGVVKGSNSSVASSGSATREQQTGSSPAGGK